MLTDREQRTEKINHAGERNGFWFRGIHSGELYLRVESYPAQSIPARKGSVVTIPGKNGTLQIVEGTSKYENTTALYECYFHSPEPMPTQLGKITQWLCVDGYQRLEDCYHPETYSLARFIGPVNVENVLNKFGRCTLLFDRRPERFLFSGEVPETLTVSGSTICNPTTFEAQPLITVYGTGPGDLTVNGTTVEVKALTDQITLDCENMNAYRQVGDGAAENKNGDIYAPEYPTLGPWLNEVRWTGGITSVEITPRWWTL